MRKHIVFLALCPHIGTSPTSSPPILIKRLQNELKTYNLQLLLHVITDLNIVKYF